MAPHRLKEGESKTKQVNHLLKGSDSGEERKDDDWPKEWIASVSSFLSIWPKQIQEKVLNKWKSYGFKD